MCCEVLEHIPFSCFEDIIRQLAGICTGTLILSVPDRSIRFRILLKVPKLRIQKDITVTRFTEKEIAFNGEHYWEAGNRN